MSWVQICFRQHFATAGFGRRVSWTADSAAEPPPGCKLTFRSAVIDSVNNVIFRALVPGWFYQLSSLIKVPYLSSRALSTQLAFDDLRTHMLDLVASARAEITSGERSGASGAALLRNLVVANMNQDGDSKRLTEGELLSNIFVSMQLIFALRCSAILLLGFPPCWTWLVDFTFCEHQSIIDVTRRDLCSHPLLCICIIGPLPRVSEKNLRRGHLFMARRCTRHTIIDSELLRPTFMKKFPAEIPTEPQRMHGQTCQISVYFLTKSAHTDGLQRNILWHASAKHFVCSLSNLACQKTYMQILSYLGLISPLDQMGVLSKLESFRWLFRRGASSSWMYGHCT